MCCKALSARTAWPRKRFDYSGQRRARLKAISNDLISAAAEPRTEGPPRDLPLYVTLPEDIVSATGQLTHAKALEAGLRALKCIGIDGVVVEVWWGVVEGKNPRQYDWTPYCLLFKMLDAVELQARVTLCFNVNEHISLPPWVLEVGYSNPHIFYMDRSKTPRLDCLSVGIDELPLLRGRSAIECYKDLMASFHRAFHPLYGSIIRDVCIGLGPQAELRYPSTPAGLWNYPGVGEFQCYDRYMLSGLQACALQVEMPEYGRDGGPHDAGSYCAWPHQTKFFSDEGSWKSDYGAFFLDWYAQNLLLHGRRVLEVAHGIFGDHVPMSAKLPAMHWWHHTASHAAELTAGINHTCRREGYIPVIQLLKRWNCAALMSAAEMSTRGAMKGAASDPEELLMHVRTCASALHIPFGLENSDVRFDEAAFSQIEEHLFDRQTANNMQLADVTVFTFNRMGDQMFEPCTWHRFKAFVVRLKQRLQECRAHRLPYDDSI